MYIYIYIYVLSLLRCVDSRFLGNSLGTWEFHPLIILIFCLSHTLWNPKSLYGDWPYSQLPRKSDPKDVGLWDVSVKVSNISFQQKKWKEIKHKTEITTTTIIMMITMKSKSHKQMNQSNVWKLPHSRDAQVPATAARS